MTEIVSEREELEKLREQYVKLITQIDLLEQENKDLTNKLMTLDNVSATPVIDSKTEENFYHSSIDENDNEDEK